jgi:hypothetical protein
MMPRSEMAAPSPAALRIFSDDFAFLISGACRGAGPTCREARGGPSPGWREARACGLRLQFWEGRLDFAPITPQPKIRRAT